MKPYFENESAVIYHGNCVDILPTLPRGVVVTDPPYNVGYHYDGYSDKMPQAEYHAMLSAVCPEPCVIIHYMEDLVDISLSFKKSPDKVVAWVYPSNTARQWRGIAWWGCHPDFNKDGQDYKNPKDKRIMQRIANGERARLYDWWEVNQVKNVSEEKTEHPCQIPLFVMERIIRITPSEIIIDPFCGSGTTLVAAKNLGKKSIGIERSEKYCEIAASRISENNAPEIYQEQMELVNNCS